MSRYNNAALGRIAVGVFDCGDFKTSPKSIELLADIIRKYDLMLLAGVTMSENGVNVFRDRVNAGQDAEHPQVCGGRGCGGRRLLGLDV